jgi:4-amino-4-deoxy-L-arabinose transferase-like glycosyltransferase
MERVMSGAAPQSSAVSNISRRRSTFVLILILLAASAFRFIGLDNFPTPRGASPPGLEHDEVAHWLINQDILAGNHAVYFTEAYGHEALYHYIQAVIGALIGDHALALRLPSAYFGVLLVAVSYALGRRMFGVRVGLWSAAFIAILFWPVFYSRLALRAISLPVFSGLAAYWWWRAFQHAPVHSEEGDPAGDEQSDRSSPSSAVTGRHVAFILAGLFGGLSLHTYMAGRAVPIFFALYTAYLALFHRPTFRKYGRGITLFWAVLALVAAPLVLYLLANPGAEIRISEVDAPLRALRQGDFRPVMENAVKIAGMFGVSGDPLWRQNVAGRPVFDPLMAVLFYAGVLLSTWRGRDMRHAFLLLWLAASAIPSIVTIDAPSSIRVINLLPVLMLFPLVFIHTTPYLSTLRDKLSTELTTRIITWGLGIILLYTAWSTYTGLWRDWPANEEVRFVWQAAMTEAAAFLDQSLKNGPVAIGGWTPETMDPPTFDLTLRRDDLSLRYFDPTQSVILPAASDEGNIRIVNPSALPLPATLRDPIAQWEQRRDEFVLYTVPADFDILPQMEGNELFGGQMIFRGYDFVGNCDIGQGCEVVTYWQVITADAEPRRIFLHAVDNQGEIVSQADGLGAPAEHWRPGDVVIQLLTLPEMTSELRLGVYNPQDGQRLTTGRGTEYVILGPPAAEQ